MTQKTVQCSFRGVSSGKYAYTLGLSLDRGEMPLDQAEGLLVGSKLEATLACDPTADVDVDGQEKLVDTDITLKVSAESRGFTVLEDRLTVTLKIHKDDVDVASLDRFCYHDGRAVLQRTGDADDTASES